MGDKTRGLYKKFKIKITRTDGQSAKGKKHHQCEYFLLDLDHDPFAWPALVAYAKACKKEYPLLAADLEKKIKARRNDVAKDRYEG